MSRVWKRFLLKISKGVGVIAYVVGSMLIGGYTAHLLGYDPGGGIAIGAVVFVLLPMIAFVIRDTYRDAKYEVERENINLLRSIGGKNY